MMLLKISKFFKLVIALGPIFSRSYITLQKLYSIISFKLKKCMFSHKCHDIYLILQLFSPLKSAIYCIISKLVNCTSFFNKYESKSALQVV